MRVLHLDRCRGGIGREPAIPAAHQVGGLAKLIVGIRRVVDRVGEPMRQLLVHLAVDIGLHGEHVRRRQMIAALQQLVNALRAIRIGPLVGEWIL